MTYLPLRILAVMITLAAILRLDAGRPATAPAAARQAGPTVHLILTDGLLVFDATAG